MRHLPDTERVMSDLKDWMICENGVMRKPTKDEIAQRKQDIADDKQREQDEKAARQERQQRKEEIAAKLGLTADELKELLDGG